MNKVAATMLDAVGEDDEGKTHVAYGTIVKELKDVSRLTGFNVPVSERYHTIAGFILDYLQRVPAMGEHILLPRWEIEIVKADSTSIDAILLTSLAKKERSEKEKGEYPRQSA